MRWVGLTITQKIVQRNKGRNEIKRKQTNKQNMEANIDIKRQTLSK